MMRCPCPQRPDRASLELLDKGDVFRDELVCLYAISRPRDGQGSWQRAHDCWGSGIYMHSEARLGCETLWGELGAAVAANDIEGFTSLTARFCLVALLRVSVYVLCGAISIVV